MTDFIHQADADVLLAVKAVPGASRDQITGQLGGRLKIKVAAPPEAGKANKAICRLLAEALGVPAGRVSIDSGQSRPEKIIRVQDAGVQAVRAALTAGR